MSVLPQRVPFAAAPAAFAAAVCVMVAFAADAGHVAAAQAHLEAEYTATLSGLPIGHGTWAIEIAEDQYTAAASGSTSGLLRIFTGARGAGATRGSFNGDQTVPTSYVATIDFDRNKWDDVRMALAGGNVKDLSAEPPLVPHPERIPVSDADRRGVVDPMSSTINRVGGNGDPVSPLACARKVAVFDGRVRYDLRSEFKRMETVKAERGYQGPVVVCAVYFEPISGYVPNRPVIKYLVALRDAEVWLAPIAGTRVLVPFRFSMPTPLGMGVLQAIQFVSAPPAGHPSVSAKTQ
ncbi:MAG: DUF3108 domain-containing protein [Xanthobacteraceae bacterium]